MDHSPAYFDRSPAGPANDMRQLMMPFLTGEAGRDKAVAAPLVKSERVDRRERTHYAVQARFAGGHGEPLHDWYPYLEGYSPAYVATILHQYGGESRRVLDPFAGTGTTPVTAVMLGLDAAYAELNPLCQTISAAKLGALTLDDRDRRQTVDQLFDLQFDFRLQLRCLPPDETLRASYKEVFGRSEFFDPDVFNLVLRARTWIDRIGAINPRAAQLATIAVLRSLIPASRLIRRGDLRFRTEPEAKRLKTTFLAEVEEGLDLVARDIEALHPATGTSRLIGSDAKELAAEDIAGADALVTSPPYLNGTNYFRNTKVELWFLRRLCTKEDLSSFRHQSITAGINDVTVAKTEARRGVFTSNKLDRIIARLEASAYDPRIPHMVSTYFADLFLAFQRCVPHLGDSALVGVDIGDSCYGDVHVPTDDLLAEILSGMSCRAEDQVVLRERLSHGGRGLRQTLLIFRRVNSSLRSATTIKGSGHEWRIKWERFKQELPHQRGEMAQRNWGHPLHSLCSYQGKLKPSIANLLVEIFVPPGGRILDPFAGVGTIPLEAALSSRMAFAFDISPPALEITRAKLGVCDAAGCEAIIGDIAQALAEFHLSDAQRRRAAMIRFNGRLEDYFHPETFREVIGAREYFRKRQRHLWSLLHCYIFFTAIALTLSAARHIRSHLLLHRDRALIVPLYPG
jgi:16S rRNA G966 N2-methylase RsmD